jgi:hypothetical protein
MRAGTALLTTEGAREFLAARSDDQEVKTSDSRYGPADRLPGGDGLLLFEHKDVVDVLTLGVLASLRQRPRLAIG